MSSTIDLGKDVTFRHAKRGMTRLGEGVSKMLSSWTEENFTYFEQTMDTIREGAPVQWVKLYMEAAKMGLVRENNINININRQADRDSLQALVKSRIPISGDYIPFEEVKPKELEKVPLKSEGE